MRDLLANYVTGFRLALGQPVDRTAFRATARQAVLLGVAAIALSFLAAGAVHTDALLETLRTSIAGLSLLFFAASVLARMLRRPGLLAELPVAILSLAPAVGIGMATIQLATSRLPPSTALPIALATVYLGWVLVASYRAMAVATGLRARILVPVYAAVLAGTVFAVIVFPGGTLGL